MGIRTLVLYLFGHRPSIEAIIQSRSAVWVGLLFVISAGFAREYDGEDLLHEPWHVLIPLGASLLTSYLLFMLLEWTFGREPAADEARSNYYSQYRAFLSLYWMTAPLAWLYAIPVEEFLSPADSVRANLSFLGVVSLWRVLLITRAASIFFNRSFAATFFLVMFFADTVAMVVFWFTPLPIISVMGGIRLTESEEVLLSVGIAVRAMGTLRWPIWLIGSIFQAYKSKPQGDQRLPVDAVGYTTFGLWGLAGISLLIWLPILPFTQPRQIHRRQAERLLLSIQVPEAVAYMSRFSSEAFPKHWDPPPRFGLGKRIPALDVVLVETEKAETATWVRDLFRDKLKSQLNAAPYSWHDRAIQLREMESERLARYVAIVRELPFRAEVARYHLPDIEHGFNEGPAPTESQKQSLEALKEFYKEYGSSKKAGSSNDDN